MNLPQIFIGTSVLMMLDIVLLKKFEGQSEAYIIAGLASLAVVILVRVAKQLRG
jgi:hypothetical protein